MNDGPSSCVTQSTLSIYALVEIVGLEEIYKYNPLECGHFRAEDAPDSNARTAQTVIVPAGGPASQRPTLPAPGTPTWLSLSPPFQTGY